MIVGAPKMGKSWLGLDLGLSVASGTPYLDTYKVFNPGPVVYIPKEDPIPLVYDRVAKVAVSKGFGGEFTGKVLKFPPKSAIPFYLDLSKGFSFDDESAEDLMSWLHEIYEIHGRLAMVILDPILRMIAGIDEFKASEIGNSVFKIAGQIQNTFGASVVLVHHRNKSSETDKNSYGSMAFHAFSEGTLYIDGNDSDAEGWRQVRGEYKSAEETKWSYRFPELDTEYRVETDESGAHQELKPTDFQSQVLTEVKRYREGTTVEELTKVLDGPPSYKIRNALSTLTAAGMIDRIPKATKQGASLKGPAKDLWRIKD
jgi:RecA-family ATPase